MVAQDFFNLLAKFQPSNSVGIEDFSDRFNFLFTVIALILCTSVVTVKQYLLRPISCYVATSVGGQNLVNYVENFCWIHGTNPLSLEKNLPIYYRHWKELDHQKVYYYQWVPFVLSLQCILFYLPRMLWQMVTYNRTGIDMTHLITTAMRAVNSQNSDRETLVHHVAKSLEQMLFHYREHRHGPAANLRRSLHHMFHGCIISKRLGTWLVMWYLIVKLLYLSNAVGQVYMMQKFLGLGTNYTYFGWDLANDIVAGRDWQQTMIFPRVTFCHVSLKHVGVNNAVVAQCVLPVNMLNEKIYVFLWFWVVLSSILTGLSIPLWLMRIYHQKNNARFVRKYLKLAETFSRKEKPLVDKFVRQFLRHDGVFLLRMMSLNAGDLITSEIVTQLWRIYREHYKHRDFRDDGRLDDLGANMMGRLNVAGASSSGICIPTAPDMESLTPSTSACGDLKKKMPSNF